MSSKIKIIALVCIISLGGVAAWFWPRPASKLPTAAESTPGPYPLQVSSEGTEALVNAVGEVPTLSPAIRTLVDSGGDYAQRVKAAALLSKSGLSQANRKAVYNWLRHPEPQDSEQRGHVFKNEVMDELCELKPLPVGLGDLLVDVYRDRAQNVVIRDYAVQHLAEFYAQRANELTDDSAGNNGDLQRAREVLWEAVGETDSSIAGTALLGLRRLSESQPEFDGEQISARAIEMARNDGVGELTRITALQVAASFGGEQIVPTAMELARSGGSVPLRISAVAALGTARNPEAVPLLTALAESGEPRLRPAARQALARIHSN